MTSDAKIEGSEYRALCEAVGHLLIAFSHIENIMTAVLKMHLARAIDPDGSKHDALRLATTVYGSMRFAVSRDAIKRIIGIQSLGETEKELVTGVWNHVGNIQSLRDMIAHQALDDPNPTADGHWIFSEFFTSRDASNAKSYRIKTESIKLASADLKVIGSRLAKCQGGQNLLSGIDTSPIAWRYKPSMLRLQS